MRITVHLQDLRTKIIKQIFDLFKEIKQKVCMAFCHLSGTISKASTSDSSTSAPFRL